MQLHAYRPAPATSAGPKLPRRVRVIVDREGAGGLLRRGGERLRSALWDARRARVLCRSLDEPIQEYPPEVPVAVRAMTVEDLDRFRDPRCRLPERRIADFADRLATGRLGVVAWLDDVVAAYGWLTVTDHFEDWSGVDVRLAEGEGYVYNGFVFPQFRGRRIYPSVLEWRLRTLRSLGCRMAYSIVSVTNAPTLRWHEKLGFVGDRELGHVKIVGVRYRVGEPIPSIARERE